MCDSLLMTGRKRLLVFANVNEGNKISFGNPCFLAGEMPLILQFSSLAKVTKMARNQQYALCRQIVVPTYHKLKATLSTSFVYKLLGPKCSLEFLVCFYRYHVWL